MNYLFDTVTQKSAEFDLTEITLPRQRNRSTCKRLAGPAPEYHPENVHQHVKLEYYKFLDTASSTLAEIVTQEGAVTYVSLESCRACCLGA